MSAAAFKEDEVEFNNIRIKFAMDVYQQLPNESSEAVSNTCY